MHDQAMDFVRYWATIRPIRVLDVGGQNINGSPKDLFPNAVTYDVLDITPAPNVTFVEDATGDWLPWLLYNVVVCTEVLEHVEQWPAVLKTCHRALLPGGRLILTCAGPGRFTHSGYRDSLELAPGEWYQNVSEEQVAVVLQQLRFRKINTRTLGHDTQATAVK